MKNPQIRNLIAEVKKIGTPLWRRVADDLEKPHRRQRVVNLSRIERYSKEGNTVIVPGKVLGNGELTKKLTIVAYSFSGSAIEKVAKAGGKAVLLSDYIKKEQKPKNALLLG